MVMKKQNGFVLVSVLVITSITTMLAFSQINENRLQERIGGNQQKELNARLAAEKGIFDAFAYIKAQNEAGNKNSEIAVNLEALSTGKDYSFPSIELSGNTFTLVSKGIMNGAMSYLKTEIEAIEESGVFNDAISACNNVRVWGSADINSFKGQAYSDATSKSNGDVSVLNGDATLGGSGNIWGNLTASGNTAGADSSNVAGTITANYTGDLGECDPLAITSEINAISAQVGSASDFNPSNNVVFDGSTVDGFTPTTLTVLGDSTEVYVFNDFNIKNNDLVISGDVTFYIQGDMTTKNTAFTLANDTSSLTIFIAGLIDVDTGSNIFANRYATANNVPLTVYSSNNENSAVTLAGNGDIYMNLYAPYGTVSYNGNGDIMGALRGDVVDISGNGDIHYDEGLGDIGDSTEEASVSYASIYYHYPEEGTTEEVVEEVVEEVAEEVIEEVVEEEVAEEVVEEEVAEEITETVTEDTTIESQGNQKVTTYTQVTTKVETSGDTTTTTVTTYTKVTTLKNEGKKSESTTITEDTVTEVTIN